MTRAYIDGEFVELTAEQIAELQKISEQDAPQNTASDSESDRVQQLVAGLSTATTIAQIRSVAKQILDETGGGESNE